MARRKTVGLILGLASLFCLDRIWVLASAGHLFTDVNPAEYGFLSVLADFGGRPVSEQLSDPRARGDLLHAFRLVGNQMHGTLGALGVVMLTASEQTGAVLGTPFLRAFGLGQATLTVVLWLVGLWRASRSVWAVVGFTVLAVLGPPVWLGLNLLCWGTHETVGLLQAALVCLALPWMAHPAAGRQQGLRVGALGLLAGVGTLLNPAVALPAVSVTLGVAVAPWVRRPTARRLVWALATSSAALALGVWLINTVLATGVLDGLGYPRGLPLERLTGLIGKNGGPLLHTRTAQPEELARWAAEARARAFLQAPTAAYGVYATLAEQVARVGILAVGGLALTVAVGGIGARVRSHRRATAWLGLHLLVGMAATLVLTRHTSLDPTVPTGAPPRYFAHLYPFGFAVLAMLSAQRGVPVRRLLAVAVAGWVGWVGGFEHARSVDRARLSPEEASIALRYDGAAAWFSDRPQSMPAPERRPFPGQSDDFRRGYAAITGLQNARYWDWIRPVDLARSPDQAANAFARALRPSGEVTDPEAYWKGVGAALRVAVPRSRMPHAATFWRSQGRWATAIREGYDAPP